MKPEYVAITEVLADSKAVVREWLVEVSGATGSNRASNSTDAIVAEAGEIARAVHDGLRAEGDVGAFDLQGITTKATLADALSVALRRTGYTVTRTSAT